MNKLVQQVNPEFYTQEALAAGQRAAARAGMAAMNLPGAKPETEEGGN